MKVVIAGGGAVGAFIADELQGAGHSVHIIEQDLARTERALASGEHAGVEWHAADACEVDSLRHIGLDDADVVAAVTGDDEDNLVISLLAKQEFAVPRVVARVNNPKNEWLFNENWGVDVAVSTPHLLTALVEEAVSVGSLVRLLTFEGGRASLIEVTLASGTPAVDREVRELPFPRDSTVVAVLRHDRVVVPRGDTRLLAGDEVLVLVTDESIDGVREILTDRSMPGPSGNGDSPVPAPASDPLPADTGPADPTGTGVADTDADTDAGPTDGAGDEPAGGGA
jgi:trk system potassium uptake protein TrkA